MCTETEYEVEQERLGKRRDRNIEKKREWKTIDRKTDSAELNVSKPNDSLHNLPVPTQ